jgi:hypothetical protein
MATNLEFINSFENNTGGIATFQLTNIFSDKYDVYKIVYDYKGNDISGYVRSRLIDSGGSVISGAEYSYASLAMRSYNVFFQNKVNGTGTWMGETGYNQDFGAGGELTVYNPYDSSSFTFAINSNAGGTTAGGSLLGYKSIYSHNVAEQITGWEFVVTGGGSYDFDRIQASVYGVK